MPSNASDPIENLWIDHTFKGLLLCNGIESVGDLFAVEGTKLVKPKLPMWRERVVVDWVDGHGGSQRFYIKRFSQRTPRSPFKSVLSRHKNPSPARVEHDWIMRLRTEGIPVPQVVAFGEEAMAGKRVRSALVLAEVLGESLERWVLRQTEVASKKLIEAVAVLARSFHGAGFIHRDFYLSHIFLQDAEGDPQLALIDLQRVMHQPVRFERWRNRDLAQLDYSVPANIAGPRQRIRFLRQYFSVSNLRDAGIRRAMKAIQRKSAQIAAHDRRRQARAAKAGTL